MHVHRGRSIRLPAERGLFYGGRFHAAARSTPLTSPVDGSALGVVADATAAEVDSAVAAAQAAFPAWRDLPPLARADRLRALAALMRTHRDELALIDALDGGNPVAEMRRDVEMSVRGIEYFAGLAQELKGESVPLGPNLLNYSRREPYGVVARIIAYNHPLMFATLRAAAPLAAGNTLIVKPPEQAPLSVLRLAELIAAADILPPGVFNVVPGGRECGERLVGHPQVRRIAFIGSVPTGRVIMRGAADSVKSVSLELGGKNALIAYPDMAPTRIADGIIKGMNFTWAGQSCGSTSRVFLHERQHDEVVALVLERLAAYVPGDPTDDATTMGALIDARQLAKVEGFVRAGLEDGAVLAAGGRRVRPVGLEQGCYFEPTVFTGVTPTMRLAREEVFGPVVAILKWRDEDAMFADVNSVEYGLSAAIYARDLAVAHRAAARVEAGYVWINEASMHYLGTPFGGVKQSGMGREEAFEELLGSTQIKTVTVSLEP